MNTSPNQPLSISAARAMSLRDLVQGLLVDQANTSVYRKAINERLAARGIANLHDLCRANGQEPHATAAVAASEASWQAPWHDTTEVADASAADFPWRDEEIVSPWMLREQQWQFAERVKASGWQGEGMRDPDETMEWVEKAVLFKNTWADLPAEGARFWKAVKSKWERWMAKKSRAA